MSRRNSPIGLLGVAAAGALAFGIWACVPAVVQAPPGGTSPNSPPADLKGAVKVAVTLPSETIQIQSLLDTLDSIDLAVTGTSWSPAATANIAKSALTDGGATRTISEIPSGPATVAATAKNAAGTALATASADVTIQSGKTADASLILKLISGKLSATISVVFTEPGTHGIDQAGATYVGPDKCMTCHTGLADGYRTSKHYKTMSDSRPAKGRPSCAQCHAVNNAASYSTAVPFDFITKAPTDSPNDLVAGISCEACHGPGSKHVIATYENRFKTITRVPDYKDTCAQCHTGYSKEFGTDGKPVFEPGSTSYQRYNPAKWDRTGVPEAVYMAGGSHNAPGMGPTAGVFNQYIGFTGGQEVTFTNSHKTLLPNGCVNCHMGGQGAAEKHTFMIHEASQSVITNTCQKCHGPGWTEDSIEHHQAQTKMAIEALKNILVAYRQAYCRETVKKTYSSISDKSTDSVKIADFSRAPSLWDDTPTFVNDATASDTTIWIDKGNWSGQDPTSPHQKLYNQAYWNYSVANGELSYGIHAPTYTQYLLRSSYNSIVNEFIAKNDPASASFKVMSLR